MIYMSNWDLIIQELRPIVKEHPFFINALQTYNQLFRNQGIYIIRVVI